MNGRKLFNAAETSQIDDLEDRRYKAMADGDTRDSLP
jgi:hypothetical protein